MDGDERNLVLKCGADAKNVFCPIRYSSARIARQAQRRRGYPVCSDALVAGWYTTVARHARESIGQRTSCTARLHRSKPQHLAGIILSVVCG